MLISVVHLERFFGVHPKGVLHVGAHEAEELADYVKHGWGNVAWVEMLPEKFEALQKRFAGDPSNLVFHAACWDRDGETLPVHRADNGQASSLLAPQYHLTAHPWVNFKQDEHILTSRLDTILPAHLSFDFLNMDIQGAELRALRGLGKRIEPVKWVFVEVNTKRLYADCALVNELDDYLKPYGFQRFATMMYGRSGWGDALYINTKSLSSFEIARLRVQSGVWFLTSTVRSYVLKKARKLRARYKFLA